MLCLPVVLITSCISVDNELKWRPSHQRTTPISRHSGKPEVRSRANRAPLVDVIQTNDRVLRKTKTAHAWRARNGGGPHAEETAAAKRSCLEGKKFVYMR